MNGDQVAVVFDTSCKTTEEAKDAKSAESTRKHSVCWLHGIYYSLKVKLRWSQILLLTGSGSIGAEGEGGNT